MAKRKYRQFVSDFETTVYDGQEYTEVWSSASVELYTEDVQIFHSINEQFDYFKNLNDNVIVYYHNLKFDGSFWLPFLIGKLGYEQAIDFANENRTIGSFRSVKDMKNNTFRYSISDKGQWYNIIMKTGDKIIEIRDSYKLLPMSLERIGNSFKTKHRKLNISYTGFRYSGCIITDQEKEYIKNDVLVIKEALEIMFNDGHNKLTIGSCCLAEFKNCYDKLEYNYLFPKLEKYPINKEIYGSDNADEYIRHSYRGGWVHVVGGMNGKVVGKGCTHDVNSLYPSVMHSESGNIYPYGLPTFWSGPDIPSIITKEHHYYFIRIKTRFYLKDGYLPFLQIKGNPLYKGSINLESSDYVDKKTGERYTHYRDINNNIQSTQVILTLTQTDYKLFLEHYNVTDFEILDGCYFQAEKGFFDEYIDKYKAIKVKSTGGIREIAKLFLNNLYGKMASSADSSFKVAMLDDEGIVKYYTIEENNKETGYIAIGSAITSYAKNFTIRAGQLNYHGKDKPGFIYADTDSIHCNIPPSEIKGVRVHPTDFNAWKCESEWDTAIFTRSKTYIEHITKNDKGEKLENPYYDVKCAGMPKRSKELFIKSLEGYTPTPEDNYNEEEVAFISKKRKLEDFKIGLQVPSKLMPVQIRGGTILVSTTFTMNKK